MGSGIEKLAPIKTTGIGMPDYSQAAPIGAVPVGNVYTISDQGELAARVGSPNTYDRRGNVIFQTDFQAAINQVTFNLGAGAGALAEQSAEVSKHGGGSLKICGGINTGSSFTWIGSMVGKSKLGIEISLCSLNTNYSQIAGTMLMYDGASLITTVWGLLRNAAGTDDLFVTDNTGAAVALANGLILPWGYRAFTTIKIVVDLETAKYERFLLNNLAYDISSVSANIAPAVFTPSIWVQIGEVSAVAITSTFYHNGFIVTQNEPANG